MVREVRADIGEASVVALTGGRFLLPDLSNVAIHPKSGERHETVQVPFRNQ